MSELELHTWVVRGIFAAAPIAVFILLFVQAPYGRHGRSGWGPTVPGRLGWILMESPAVLGFAWIFLSGQHHAMLAPLVLLAMWQLHYVHRTFIYPFRLRSPKPWPLLLVAVAFAYQSVNAWANATWIGHLGHYPDTWLSDPRFLIGAGVFASGMAINLHADTVLLKLRAPGDTGYHIPTGGLYRWVTCANYFGELVIWTGWAIATWSWAGLSFMVFTAANLAPRAAQNHRWYLEKFGEAYPKARKRLLPGLW